MKRMFFILPILTLLLGPVERAVSQTSEAIDSDTMASIKEASDRYIDAFNQHDAVALARLWVEDATYVTQNGKELQGRKEIEEAFKTFFKNNPGVSMGTVESEILSVTGERAVATGITAVTFADGSVEDSDYLVYLKKVGEDWLIQAEGETDPEESPPASFFLKDLEWLIGSWKDEGEGVTVESTYEWSFRKNSIRGTFKVTRDGELEMDGIVRIGWDPIERVLRSWTFDSDGGDAEGAWYQRDGKWYVKKLHVLPGGQLGSSLSVFNPIDENHIEWKSVSREAGGEMLPDVGPVNMVRVTEEGK